MEMRKHLEQIYAKNHNVTVEFAMLYLRHNPQVYKKMKQEESMWNTFKGVSDGKEKQ